MPEYLAPGVYVEETSFRAKSIEGVGTSTTAFVGPTRKGPYRVDNDTPESPELLTSYGDFERIYGGFADLSLGAGVPGTNYLAHAVRAFFNEGGSRLYVSRVVGASPAAAAAQVIAGTDEGVGFVARFPGAVGNGRLVVREATTPASETTLNNAPAGSVVRATVGGSATLLVRVGSSWRPAANLAAEAVTQTNVLAGTPQLLTVSVLTIDGDGNSLGFEDMGLTNTHPRWIGHVMSATPSRRSDHLQNLYAISVGVGVTPAELHAGLFNGAVNNSAGQPERVWTLTGGADGGEPTATDYALALSEIASLEDVSIVAAPGSSAYGVDDEDNPQAIASALIAHAEGRRAYRIAVLDTPPELLPTTARTYRGLVRLQIRRHVLPVGGGEQPAGAPRPRRHSERDRAAAVGLRERHLRAQRRAARRAQGAGQRGGARCAALRDRREFCAAGAAQPRRRELPALLQRARQPRLGRAR